MRTYLPTWGGPRESFVSVTGNIERRLRIALIVFYILAAAALASTSAYVITSLLVLP